MTNEYMSSMDTLLSSYVSGTLPTPVQVLIESHLELSTANHDFVSGLEMAAGDQLSSIAPTAFRDRDSALEAIFSSEPVSRSKQQAKSCGILPTALQDFIGFKADDIPWKTKMPGFREYDLPDIDGCHVSMFWIKPGRTVPAHTHEGVELSLIVDGAFHDSRGRFGRGDISIADDSVDHRPTAETDRPCIGFAVCDGALRLTGPLHQRLGDIIAG
ncbi:MAG: ChrR family anti-sigma-E factor [Pseudomonadota bacterium]